MPKKKQFRPKVSKKLSKKYTTHRLYYSDNSSTFNALDPRKKTQEKQDKLLEMSNQYHRKSENREKQQEKAQRDEIIKSLKEEAGDIDIKDSENYSDLYEVGPSAHDLLLSTFKKSKTATGNGVGNGRGRGGASGSSSTAHTSNGNGKRKIIDDEDEDEEDEEEEEDAQPDEEQDNNNDIEIEIEDEDQDQVEHEDDDEDQDVDEDDFELDDEEAEDDQDDEEDDDNEDGAEGEDEEEQQETGEFDDVYGTNQEVVEEDDEEDDGKEDGDNRTKLSDDYSAHFNQDVSTWNQLEEIIEAGKALKSTSIEVENFGVVTSNKCPPSTGTAITSTKKAKAPAVSSLPIQKDTFYEYHIKHRLLKAWAKTKKTKENELFFTPIQKQLFPIMNEYRDLLFSEENHKNHKSIYQLYTLHAMNHVLKSRDQLTQDNGITKRAEANGEVIPDMRHQGFTKPKVLIIVPFRNTALDIMKLMLKLVPHETHQQVEKKTTLIEEFTHAERQLSADKPADFRHVFRDNIDDCFRVGIGFNKNGMKLFCPFFFSDIIIASPLGLRLVVGTEGDAQRDNDFLSSIEMVIVDQVETILQQNWDHMNIIFDNLNLIPKKNHNTDFSRIRMATLEGWSKHFRQTLMFSNFLTPEVNSLFNRHCTNIRGNIRVRRIKDGEIANIIPSLMQTFHKVPILKEHNGQDVDARFDYLIETILLKFSNQVSETKNVLIYIPNYFEYIKIRNYFKKEAKSFVMCCEYTAPAVVTRSRAKFRYGDRTYMLITERFHFFNRYQLRGVKHVVFFGLPNFASYYSEILNMVSENEGTVMALYTQRDRMALERIVGSIRATKMLESDKSTHLFC
ncbi:hypothetical protein SAMD00019534_005230 [Acytostelium subglobosum LB1]|uniref:hypothetical protein n=1 Tax=Acytostelium subglobosum LB1 TaxID=1410327 RepID=UPI0006447D5D|nr:hypothetical protein SAMD00019534_005230 [Acytostelium subglobosum LB1]GAM17348.1 hypothetical protein SAMD00019534_005230 [Acytostelium subglobosum LB1]|eukprot:XP_012759410.1 hypothetical protein SAMD00019534_005230 [Acytostelium subglobosum LB1]